MGKTAREVMTGGAECVGDGHDLVGVVSQGDLATNIPEERVGNLVEAISAAP
jgi:hypothetical protein